MFMIKLRNVAILASAALLLAGTILSTMGIFTAYSAQTKEKDVYEEMLSGRTSQTEDFNATRTKIINTINMRNRAFTFLAYGMLSFGLGVTVFTLGSYQGTIIPKRWTFIPKRLRRHAEAEKREEELPVELGPPLVPPTTPTAGYMTLRCKACKSSFTVESKARPFKVKCPYCGAEGTI